MSKSPESVAAQLDLLRRLLPAAEQLGLILPGAGRMSPTIDLGQPINALSLDVGRLVAKHNIFLKVDEVVTVDAATGVERRMNPRRFCSWIEQFAAIRSAGGRQRRDSLTPDDAALILEADNFRGTLRPLERVHLMRLPVRREGTEDVVFLPEGYDRESRTFTADVLKYDMTWPLARATEFLNEHGAEYCFTFPEGRSPDISLNRNWSVQIAAMLGIFCGAMFEVGTARPMIIYVGNKPGTGKSTLVSMALFPVFGTAATTAIPKDDDRMISTLEAISRTRRPYVFFDDVKGGIFNNALYEFVTSRAHGGRVMGGNAEFFELPNVTQVFATGNDIKFDDNLRRRALVVELFLATEVRGRKFRRVISPAYLAHKSVRADFLSALCAIVRNYATEAPFLTADQRAATKPLESFEDWTSTISAMVQLAGYNDPLAPAELAGAGAVDDDEMKDLLIRVVSAEPRSREFTRKELAEKARGFGLLERIVGAVGDPDPDQRATIAWGKMLQKYRGQEYTDAHGRVFRFSHRRIKTGAIYPFTFLDVGPSLLPATYDSEQV